MESGKKKIVKHSRMELGDALENLVSKQTNFLNHVFIENKRVTFNINLSVGEKSAVSHVDFSENFTLKEQGGIQA